MNRYLWLGFLLAFLAEGAICQSTTPFSLNERIVRELVPGQSSDTVELWFEAGKIVLIEIGQPNINLFVTIADPNGEQLLSTDNPNGVQSSELLVFHSEVAGNYRIEVRPTNGETRTGKYPITIHSIRERTKDDEVLLEAQQLIERGSKLLAKKDDESARVAADAYEAASERFERLADDTAAAHFLRLLGNIFDDVLYKRERAIELYNASIDRYERIEQKRELLNVFNARGIAYENIFRYDDAVASYERALEIARQLGDKGLQAKTHNQLGRGFGRMGDFRTSLSHFLQAQKLNEGTAWNGDISVTLTGLGIVYNALGDTAKAVANAHKNLSMLIETGATERAVAAQLLNIGNIYQGQGNLEMAEDFYRRALAGFESGNAEVGTSYALNNIGNTLSKRGNYADALIYLERSRQMKTKFMQRDPGSLVDIARLYQLQGKHAESLELYQQGLTLFLESGEMSGAAIVLNAMSEISRDLGKASDALSYAQRAVALAEQTSQTELWLFHTSAGLSLLSLGEVQKARKQFETSIVYLEELRSKGISGSITGANLSDQMADPYKALALISIREGRFDKALGYSEGFRSRLLAETLQVGKIDYAKDMAVAEREDELSFKRTLALLNVQATAAKEPAMKARLNERLSAKRLEYEDFLNRIRASRAAFSVQRGEMKPVRLEEANSLLRSEKAVAVEFLVTTDEVAILMLTGNGDARPISVRQLNFSRSKLSDLIHDLRKSVAHGDLNFQELSRELYALLIKPIEMELQGKTNIVIVPDGPLWDLPFQALVDESGKFLIEKAAISYAPSLTALREMSKKARTRRAGPGAELIAFGNPVVGKETKERVQRVFMSEELEPLPEAERLVNELGKMYGPKRSKVLTGNEAREEVAKSETPKYRIVQFATHGILNNTSPMYSHLVMAQDTEDPNEDGLLEAWELKDLDLNADMVILSACDTARGKVSGGEGIIGMTWASFIAGSPTTVASQWKVESSSTTEFMLEFHRQLLAKKRVSKAAAMRRAALKLMRTPKYRHPSYWGAWVLVGDGS